VALANTFQKTFSNCWHTAENPCKHFVECINDGQKCHQSDTTVERVQKVKDKLLLVNHSNPVVLVGMGTCGLANGANKVYDAFKKATKDLDQKVDIVPVGCVGFCAKEVIVDIKLPNHPRLSYSEVTPDDVEGIVEETIKNGRLVDDKVLGLYASDEKTNGWSKVENLDELSYFKKQKKIILENCGVIDPESIDQYLARKGYSALSKVLNDMSQDEVIGEVKDAGLRGRGGGGFPAGVKWEMAKNNESDKKYIVCNADEGDPGAFMDRALLEGDPHKVVEGMVIAAFAIGADEGYIYCRAEYPLAITRLEKTITDAKVYGLLGENILGTGFNFNLKIKKGAGAFVCGEETALLNSIEGKRGTPNPKPPYPAAEGLFGKPTIINNVETFANVPVVLREGSGWYSAIGTEGSKGTKIFALSGKIKNVGLVEVPMGTTIREVIFDIGGGIADGKEFKAVQIGGPSGGALPAKYLDTPIEYESLKKIGAMMGSGGLVVMDETTCMVDLAKYFMTFIQSESCGKCIPCREGTKRLLEILERLTSSHRSERSQEDSMKRFQGMVYLERLADVIKNTSLCGLGQTAANPVLSTLENFRDEYEAHLYDRKCPAGVCRELLTYTIDTDACTGCHVCAVKCPSNAILGEVKKAHYIIDEKCTRCDQCRSNCKYDAITVE
jgi:NADH:ubiquinone oxidoreductase subunit F (NADH-binding)/(2Fe-2S) ferredoxin/Pyruvate/2-oxoacid:ferredoxin oxidoreductase delta subunit